MKSIKLNLEDGRKIEVNDDELPGYLYTLEKLG